MDIIDISDDDDYNEVPPESQPIGETDDEQNPEDRLFLDSDDDTNEFLSVLSKKQGKAKETVGGIIHLFLAKDYLLTLLVGIRVRCARRHGHQQQRSPLPL
jgi:hypothetical protein